MPQRQVISHIATGSPTIAIAQAAVDLGADLIAMSTRGRGEPNSFNVLRLARPQITVDRQTWDDELQTFRQSWTGAFQHTPDGWIELSSERGLQGRDSER